MSGRVVDTLSEAIEIALAGGDVMCKCPAHEDGMASLHVKRGDKQPVIMKCHAGCDVEAILREGNVDPASIMDPDKPEVITPAVAADRKMWTPVGQASDVYQYYAEDGKTLLFEVMRVPVGNGKKRFMQRHPDITQSSGYKWNMDGVRRVLYMLPEVIQGKADGKTIHVVEGEKDVKTVVALGEVATTAPMGAGKWEEEYSEVLAGANVVIIVDKDDAGRLHARKVRESLIEHGCTVSLKEAKVGCKDVTDHVMAGGTLDTLIETLPDGDGKTTGAGVDVLNIVKRVLQPSSFVIPGVLASGDRWLLTAFEGHGKSTLLRQLAVMTACGIHPFTFNDMPRQKVLLIDAENHPDQVLESWQKMVNLAKHYGHELREDELIVLETWDMDLDLTSEEGAAYLLGQVHGHQPKLVGIGPLYNLSSRDLSEHQVATRLKQSINAARAVSGAAFIMEHHAPHGQGGTERSVRPYGSSVFLKWPDFGHGLKPDTEEGVYELQKTRFNRVRGREFPPYMRWGRPENMEWDWMPAFKDEQGNLY
jgi:5S rRNA maturation endonuclease (ribonuclease M5)